MGIYVWGTGCGASEMLEEGFPLELITAFVDSYPCGETFLGKPVLYPRQLPIPDCSLLIISARHADAIAKAAEELGIPRNKLLFLKNSYELKNRNALSCAEKVLPPDVLSLIVSKQRSVTVPKSLVRSLLPEKDLENDYVRLSTLELLCSRLKNVPGACAELGVYRGYFARCINMLLPERRLYLFDTFQGFSPADAPGEAFQAAHQNTSVAQVLSIMPSRENITIMPGFFPGSLQGLEERFALVSLDVDFEATTLEGLRYFWPRLSPGGYILLHDWNCQKLPGVKSALTRYEQELGFSIPSVPISDVGGTLVLCK